MVVDSFLEGSVAVHVILDRDFKAYERGEAVVTALREIGVSGHVWTRKEIENYLVVPPCSRERQGLFTTRKSSGASSP